MALQNKKSQLSKRKSQGEIKISRESQMSAWRQDGLADCGRNVTSTKTI
jgi:hypothetical protein